MLKINPDGTYSAHFKCLKGVLKGSKEFKCSNSSMEMIENQPFCDTISEDLICVKLQSHHFNVHLYES